MRTEDIDIKGASMVHDFAITEHYVLFLDLPVVFDSTCSGSAVPGRVAAAYGARVGVMPRYGGNADVRWFDVELCCVNFRALNACRIAPETSSVTAQ